MLHQIFKTELDYRILGANDQKMVITLLLRLCEALQKKAIEGDRWKEGLSM